LTLLGSQRKLAFFYPESNVATKEEKAAYQLKWYHRNKDRVLAERRAKVTDEVRAEWRKRNAARKEYMKKWAARNKEHVLAVAKKYREDNKEKVQAYGRGYRQRGLHILSRCKRRADGKGQAFDLTEDWIESRLSLGTCELSGLKFTPRGDNEARMASIDRRDATKGYTQDNCRVICWALNAAFNDWGEDESRLIWKEYLTRHPLKE
jgi:hypothetical protein